MVFFFKKNIVVALKHALKERMKAREDRKNTLAAAAVADSTAAD